MRRLETFFTLWLVGQILLPFTAPFPTCDVADFLGRTTSHQGVPLAPSSSTTALGDAAYSYVPPLATSDGRLKLVVVSAPPAAPLIVVPVPAVGAHAPALPEAGQRRAPHQQTNLRL